MSNMIVTVLIENTTTAPDLNIQHGLSVWIDTGHEHILVDTGQDDSFLHNARIMGIDIATVSRLVLTHGHYDHTGGVPALLEMGCKPIVTAHPQAWGKRLSCHKGAPPNSIGIKWPQELLASKNIILESACTMKKLSPGVWTTGRISNFMGLPPSKSFQRQIGDYWQTDKFIDEQSLVLSTKFGLVVITGCCHSGVINTLLAAQLASGNPKIYAIIGGLHLHDMEEQEILKLAHDMQAFNIQHLWVNHCTGTRAFEILHNVNGWNVAWAGTGTRIELPPLITENDEI